MADDFTDLLIRIGEATSQAEERYPVEAILEDGSFFDGDFLLPKEALLESGADASRYGLHLFNALFEGPGQLHSAYRTALTLAKPEAGGRLRLRLWIDSKAAHLHALRWERLLHAEEGGVPLAAREATPFSRYVGLDIADPLPLTARPIKMVVAIANPERLPPDLKPLDVEQEIRSVVDGVGSLHAQRQKLDVTILHGRTPLSDALRHEVTDLGYRLLDGPTHLDRVMEQLQGCHIFHFIGHGSFRRRSAQGEGQASLFLEGPNGREWEIVSDEELVKRLKTLDQLPHLLYLSACESAVRDDAPATQPERHSPFVGLAPKLVRAGVPAVLAMQDLVPMTSARAFASAFYDSLQEHGIVDRALNEARSRLFTLSDSHWDIPVLFMRLRTGHLLTADPIQGVLESILQHKTYRFFKESFRALPTDVIHVAGCKERPPLEWLDTTATAALDVVDASLSLLARAAPASGGGHTAATPDAARLILLVGGEGSNAPIQLRRLVYHTANASLRGKVEERILPLLINLADFPKAQVALSNPIKTLILLSLQPFWPGLTADGVEDLLHSRSGGPPLRMLFDGSDLLPERMRHQAWRAIQELMDEAPHHQYMMVIDPATLNPAHFVIPDLHLLLVQPMSHVKIRRYLTRLAKQEPEMGKLLARLEEGQLFDLVEIPAFLLRAMQIAGHGQYPESRTSVLRARIDRCIASIPADDGMQACVEATLCALAWQMQAGYRPTLTVKEAFDTMGRLRGNREYNLETFHRALISSELISPVGVNELRFTYQPVQAYCCAEAILGMNGPERERVLNDITAMLGRMSRLRWWQEVLVFVSGMVAGDEEALTRLLQRIIYGMRPVESEPIFLAARCLLESRQHSLARHSFPIFDYEDRAEQEILEALQGLPPAQLLAVRKREVELVHPRTAIVAAIGRQMERHNARFGELEARLREALVWRMKATHEPRLAHRVRAAELLGQIGDTSTLAELSAIAASKSRTDLQAQQDYDFSSVRMAAALALNRLYRHLGTKEALQIPQPLRAILGFWEREDLPRLLQFLRAQELSMTLQAEQDSSVKPQQIDAQTIASFALVDIVMQVREVEESGSAEVATVLEALKKLLLAAETTQHTRWAISHSLAMLDSAEVTEQIILDFFRQDALAQMPREHRLQLAKCMVYLIGRIRCQHPDALAFLLRCYLDASLADVRLWGCVLDAVGLLADQRYKSWLEQVARGRWERAVEALRPLVEPLPALRLTREEEGRLAGVLSSLQPEEEVFLRQRAIEALASIGDRDSIRYLREGRTDWSPDLRPVFYWTCEEIFWRLTRSGLAPT